VFCLWLHMHTMPGASARESEHHRHPAWAQTQALSLFGLICGCALPAPCHGMQPKGCNPRDLRTLLAPCCGPLDAAGPVPWPFKSCRRPVMGLQRLQALSAVGCNQRTSRGCRRSLPWAATEGPPEAAGALPELCRTYQSASGPASGAYAT